MARAEERYTKTELRPAKVEALSVLSSPNPGQALPCVAGTYVRYFTA